MNMKWKRKNEISDDKLHQKSRISINAKTGAHAFHYAQVEKSQESYLGKFDAD